MNPARETKRSQEQRDVHDAASLYKNTMAVTTSHAGVDVIGAGFVALHSMHQVLVMLTCARLMVDSIKWTWGLSLSH